MDSLRLLRAFHEAGHLVAAVTLGVDVLAVTLAPGDTSMAGCTTTGRRCTGRCTDAARLASVTDEGVLAAAGRFGEAIWWEGVSGPGDGGGAAGLLGADHGGDRGAYDES